MNVWLETEISILGIDFEKTFFLCVLIFYKYLKGEDGVFCKWFAELKFNGPMNGVAFLLP